MADEEQNIPEEPNLGGRPPKFETSEAMQAAVDKYFEEVPLNERTITGLALHLGFESRQSLYDYEKIPGFSYIVKTARLQVEHSYEKKLSSSNPTGPIFALKNMGWKDRHELEHSGDQENPVQVQSNVTNNVDYSKLSTAALQEILDNRIKSQE